MDDSVNLSPIATVNTELNGDSIHVTFESSDGAVLYTNYELVPDEKGLASKGKLNDISTSQMITSYEALKTTDTYTYTGTIVTNGKKYRYSENFDISDFYEIEKADFLYSVGEISEEDKYGFILDYFSDESAVPLDSSTFITHELEEYLHSTSLSNNFLTTKLNAYISQTSVTNNALSYYDKTYRPETKHFVLGYFMIAL